MDNRTAITCVACKNQMSNSGRTHLLRTGDRRQIQISCVVIQNEFGWNDLQDIKLYDCVAFKMTRTSADFDANVSFSKTAAAYLLVVLSRGLQ